MIEEDAEADAVGESTWKFSRFSSSTFSSSLPGAVLKRFQSHREREEWMILTYLRALSPLALAGGARERLNPNMNMNIVAAQARAVRAKTWRGQDENINRAKTWIAKTTHPHQLFLHHKTLHLEEREVG